MTIVYSIAHESRRLQISERFHLSLKFSPDCDCNSTLSADIYFSPILCIPFEQVLFIFTAKMQEV